MARKRKQPPSSTAANEGQDRIVVTCDLCPAAYHGPLRNKGPLTNPEVERVRSLARREGWATRGQRSNGDHCPVCRKAIGLLVSAYRLSGPPDAPDGRTWINKETEAEFNAFLHTGGKLLDIPPEALWHISVDEVIAATQAEDREEAAAPPKRGRGRPPTPHKHLWITYTVEAYRSAGLRAKAACNRAAEKWELSSTYIKDAVYRGNKLPKLHSKAVRDFFSGDTADDVDETIGRFRAAERE
jgi:hypothetical protein